MEANLLPYLVAHMAIQPNQDWDNDWEMATLISSRIAVTPAHAVPSGPLTAEGQHVFWLDFPQRPELDFHDVRVTPVAYDLDVDFAVLKLEEPLELPTADPVFSAERCRKERCGKPYASFLLRVRAFPFTVVSKESKS